MKEHKYIFKADTFEDYRRITGDFVKSKSKQIRTVTEEVTIINGVSTWLAVFTTTE